MSAFAKGKPTIPTEKVKRKQNIKARKSDYQSKKSVRTVSGGGFEGNRRRH